MLKDNIPSTWVTCSPILNWSHSHSKLGKESMSDSWIVSSVHGKLVVDENNLWPKCSYVIKLLTKAACVEQILQAKWLSLKNQNPLTTLICTYNFVVACTFELFISFYQWSSQVLWCIWRRDTYEKHKSLPNKILIFKKNKKKKQTGHG